MPGRWLIYDRPRHADREEAETLRRCTCCGKPSLGTWDDQSFGHAFGTEVIWELVSACCGCEMDELKETEED